MVTYAESHCMESNIHFFQDVPGSSHINYVIGGHIWEAPVSKESIPLFKLELHFVNLVVQISYQFLVLIFFHYVNRDMHRE